MNRLRNQRIQSKCFNLGEYVEHWYKSYKMSKHALTTVHVQTNYINTHIKPSTLGQMPLGNVRTSDIQAFLKDLLTKGNKCKLSSVNKFGKPLANSTVQKIRAILVGSLKQAAKERLILQNFAEDTESIPLKKRKYDFFSESEKKEFLKYTKNHRFYLAYKLLFFTGLRRGELLALSWRDLDFKGKTILVHQALIVPESTPILKPSTKTDASLRILPLSPDLVAELKLHLKQQSLNKKEYGSSWKNYADLIFVNRDGSYHNPKYFSKNFKNIIKKMGINPHLHVHCTRHTFATDMLQLKTAIPDLKALGGWSTTDTLMEIYAHTVQSSQRRAMKRLYDSFSL